MSIHSEEEFIQYVRDDEFMMDVLKAAKELKLADWWVCAGFIRIKIWDTLHGFSQKTAPPDIDVIYFDKTNTDEAEEKKLEAQLKELKPGLPWSVKNQARMHTVNNIPPYLSSVDAISKFPETVTALGLSLDANNHIRLAAPWGIEDALNMRVKPTPFFTETQERAAIYEKRIKEKNWKSKWPQISVEHVPSEENTLF
ncbi:nucleotidyltransferase family protein [Salipaludibacillus sp. CUR1]|uniref:nucleotidyltransferase family protein n=1 Tax=Salipaludibacillus sp. CUR1 TaxID=2820003 RepID=UPI001E315F87|nr:nucleotidyltransferase family protein [Salipaludibacillus sp. CUR1]MCE7790880.1 nucleotidyltransferase family protein [Salipaludibacillus sp. CUR1]